MGRAGGEGESSPDFIAMLADYRRAEAVVRASDEALRKHRTPEIEAAALRASEELVRCRVRLIRRMRQRGWDTDDATAVEIARDELLLGLPDGALPG